MKSVEMSRALTAAMSLRLPGTAGKLANKMRYVDSKGPLFHDGGLIRNITQGKHEKVYAVGISSKSKSMPALGGLLYGAAALRHDLVVANNEVSEGQQDSRVDINDMNFLGASERLVWKEFILVYRLLSDLMSSDTKPDIIFVDIPLLVSRAEQSVFLEEEDVQEDWQALLNVMEDFWQRHLNDFYPNNPDGPFLVSLQTKRDLNSAVLNAIREEGQSGSPEAIDDKIVNLIREDWGQLRRVGILRFLKGTLKAGRRTAAFYYESLSKYMKRFEPKLVSEHGLVGFHLQVGLRTPIWKSETIGKRDSWSTESLDKLAGLISYLTIHDNPKMKPLPLWFAEQLVRMPKEVLISYLKSTLAMLRDREVDQTWLESIDTIQEEVE